MVGWGMATSVYPAGQRPAGAKATIDTDGKIVIRSATHEIGTGTYTTMSQIAADSLGIPIDDIRFELGDSDFPEAPTNGGSWLTASVGPAVIEACADLKKKFLAPYSHSSDTHRERTSEFNRSRPKVQPSDR